MKGPYGWVLNMGGRHGTPGIASPENIVAVSKVKAERNPRKKSRGGTVQLYANPYDTSARGFYFSSAAEFEKQYKAHLPVEEYEIEFIDGSSEDAKLFDALRVSQAFDLERYFDEIVALNDHDKAALYYYLKYYDSSADLDDALRAVDDEVRVFEGDVKAYAENYVDDMGGVAELGKKLVEQYFDYEAFGRDLAYDLDADDPDDARLLDMSDQKRGEEYVDQMGSVADLGKNAENYFDMDAFARDLELGGDVTEFDFAGTTYTTDYHG